MENFPVYPLQRHFLSLRLRCQFQAGDDIRPIKQVLPCLRLAYQGIVDDAIHSSSASISCLLLIIEIVFATRSSMKKIKIPRSTLSIRSINFLSLSLNGEMFAIETKCPLCKIFCRKSIYILQCQNASLTYSIRRAYMILLPVFDPALFNIKVCIQTAFSGMKSACTRKRKNVELMDTKTEDGKRQYSSV